MSNPAASARPADATWVVRRLEPGDASARSALGAEAFGGPAPLPATAPPLDRPESPPVGRAGRREYGAFDADHLGAMATDRAYDAWYAGRPVPVSGIAGVAVSTEDRGRGLLRPLLTGVLQGARERGAVISTLHPSATRIYRGFGYEVVGEYRVARVPAWSLGQLRLDPEVSVRRARPADAEAVRDVYDRWASAYTGPLTRRGVSFEDDAELPEGAVLSVAVDSDGQICGWARWSRGGEDADTLQVDGLVAERPAAYRSLLAMIGSASSVVSWVSLQTSGLDVLRTFVPTSHWEILRADPHMLRILDVAGAVRSRGYLAGLDLEVSFALAGDTITGQDGGYRVRVADGSATCTPIPADADGSGAPALAELPRFDLRGLGLAYAGVQPTAILRSAGLLSGSADSDALIDAAFAAPPFQTVDFF